MRSGILSGMIIVVGLAIVLLAASFVIAEEVAMSEFVVEGTYEDVRYDLDDAIVSRGLAVDHISHVSAMLQRTAGVVEGAKQIYRHGEQFQFCSAKLSRAAMQANPANIIFCPYMIYLYERVDQPKKVRIGYRKLNESGSEASQKALRAVNNLLQEIITEVSGN